VKQGVHAAHGGAQEQSQVVDMQALGQQHILCRNHVVISVFRKPNVHAIARLKKLPVTDAVGQHVN
jgi:hypothetical protein